MHFCPKRTNLKPTSCCTDCAIAQQANVARFVQKQLLPQILFSTIVAHAHPILHILLIERCQPWMSIPMKILINCRNLLDIGPSPLPCATFDVAQKKGPRTLGN